MFSFEYQKYQYFLVKRKTNLIWNYGNTYSFYNIYRFESSICLEVILCLIVGKKYCFNCKKCFFIDIYKFCYFSLLIYLCLLYIIMDFVNVFFPVWVVQSVFTIYIWTMWPEEIVLTYQTAFKEQFDLGQYCLPLYYNY